MVPGAPVAPTGGNVFPLDIKDSLQAGLPVYLQQRVIIHQADEPAGDNIIDELIVPNPATGGRTTTQWINSAGNTNPSDVQMVVNVKTVSGDTTTNTITTTSDGSLISTKVKTAVKSGNSTVYTIVTTPANGTAQTTWYADVVQGNKVIVKDASRTTRGLRNLS
jgi:hypothetical protein